MAITVQMRTEITQLYVALFGRAPDTEGLGFWVGLRDAGQSLTQIANTMYATAPARAYYPLFLTNQEIIASFYVNVLGRTADAEGLAFWTAKLNAAGATPGSVITEMINVVVNYTGTHPDGLISQDLFNNKVEVAQYYGENAGSIEGATAILALVTADHASVDAAIASLNETPPTEFFMVTGVENINAGDSVNAVVHGIGDVAGTYNTGDVVKGSATTTLDLTLNGTAGLVEVVDVGTVEVNLLASTTLSNALYSGVGTVEVTSALAGTALTVTNADLSTDYGLAAAGVQNTLTVTYTNTAGTADTATLLLGGTGTSATVASTVDVTNANTIEAVAIGTSGTNFATVNAGTGAKTITLAGSGANTLTFGATAAALTVDASTTTAAQKLTFVSGSIDSADTIKGGSSTGDQVTANAMTTAVKMSGVETLVTTFEGGVFFAGENITGLTTLTANQATAAGNITLNNMNNELATVNSNGPVGKITVNYADAGAALTVNYGDGTAKDTDFDGLRVRDVAAVTVNFNGTGDYVDATDTGVIDLDADVTTALTVKVNGSTLAGTISTTVDAIENYDSLTSLTVSATGTNSYLWVQDMEADDTTAAQLALETITVSATGNGASAYLEGFDGSFSTSSSIVTAYSQALSISTVSVTASGDNSTAQISDYILTAGPVDSITVTASGDGSSAWFSGLTAFSTTDTAGDVAAVTIEASGDTSFAGLSSLIVYGGDVGTVSIIASGQSASASLNSDLEVFGGNIGTVLVEASGASAWAGISDIFITAGDLGSVSIVASGDTASASLSSEFEIDGNVGSVNVTASGANSWAGFYGSDFSVNGDLDEFNLTASGASAEVDALSGDSGEVFGDLGALTITASGADSSASLDSTLYVYGNVGTVSVTASGAQSTASNYWLYASGDVDSITATASGLNAYAFAGASYTVETGMNVGSLTAVASGVDSTATASAYAGTGIINVITVTASDDGASALAYASADAVQAINLSAVLNSDVYLYVDQASQAGTVTITGAGDFDLDFIDEGPTTVTAGSVTGVVNISSTSAAGASNITTGSGADIIATGAGGDTVSTGAGADIIATAGGADTINGGTGADTINAGTGKDVITGGSSADTFQFLMGDSGTPSATGFDTITDFAIASDIIDFTATTLVFTADATAAAAAGDAAISASGIATFHANDDTLSEMITAVNASMTASTAVTGTTAVFSFGSDTYVYVYDVTATTVGAADVLIKLTGVTGVTAGDVTTSAGNLMLA